MPRPPAEVGPSEPDRIAALSRLFKALGDEQRLRILFLLIEKGELNVSQIGGDLDQSQPAISHHLAQLRQAGLIDFRREGKFNFYKLGESGLRESLHGVLTSPWAMELGGLRVKVQVLGE